MTGRKIHFIGALEGNQSYYNTILDEVETLGYRIMTRHSATRNIRDVASESPAESEQYSHKMIGWIKESDMVLVEATVSNFGAGFEIATSLKYGRPVVVLYQMNGNNTPYVLFGEKDPRLIIAEYTPESMPNVLKHSLLMAEDLTNERFTMLLPAKITKYLDAVAEEGTSRSDYIRSLIVKDMKK